MQNKEIEEAKKSLEKFAYTIHGTFSVGEAKRLLQYIDQLENKVKVLEKEYISKQVIQDYIREYSTPTEEKARYISCKNLQLFFNKLLELLK